MNTRMLGALLASTLSLIAIGVTPAFAGLNGQPAPPAEVADKIRTATADLLRGNVGTARPALLLLVESNAKTDLTGLLTRAIGDDTTYNGIAATLDEAINGAKNDADRSYLIYNLARLHQLRAHLLTPGPAQRSVLSAAAAVADRFPADLSDPVAWELKGDIDAESEDITGAQAAYRKMAAVGGSNALSLYKMAQMYVRMNRLPLAQSSLEQAQRALTSRGGDPALRYGVYQEMANVLLLQGNDPAALVALSQSAKVTPDADRGGTPAFRYRTDVASRLLQRGHAREVLAYAEAALRAAPEDTDLQTLRDQARAAARRGR